MHVSSEVYSSTDHRHRGHLQVAAAPPRTLPDPPAQLVARAPHAWDFTQVDR